MTDNELRAYLEDAEKNPRQIAATVSGLHDKVLRYKPAPDKWSILEVLGHAEQRDLSGVVTGFRVRFQATRDQIEQGLLVEPFPACRTGVVQLALLAQAEHRELVDRLYRGQQSFREIVHPDGGSKQGQ